jgi:hypothetical protein
MKFHLEADPDHENIYPSAGRTNVSFYDFKLNYLDGLSPGNPDLTKDIQSFEEILQKYVYISNKKFKNSEISANEWWGLDYLRLALAEKLLLKYDPISDFKKSEITNHLLRISRYLNEKALFSFVRHETGKIYQDTKWIPITNISKRNFEDFGTQRCNCHCGNGFSAEVLLPEEQDSTLVPDKTDHPYCANGWLKGCTLDTDISKVRKSYKYECPFMSEEKIISLSEYNRIMVKGAFTDSADFEDDATALEATLEAKNVALTLMRDNLRFDKTTFDAGKAIVLNYWPSFYTDVAEFLESELAGVAEQQAFLTHDSIGSAFLELHLTKGWSLAKCEKIWVILKNLQKSLLTRAQWLFAESIFMNKNRHVNWDQSRF